jgi:hypothetical protein
VVGCGSEICGDSGCIVCPQHGLSTKKKNSTPEAATEDDWNMPMPDEGTPQCVFFGDCWTADWFVLGYGNYRYDAIKK